MQKLQERNDCVTQGAPVLGKHIWFEAFWHLIVLRRHIRKTETKEE
jgi:hypothetical protein